MKACVILFLIAAFISMFFIPGAAALIGVTALSPVLPGLLLPAIPLVSSLLCGVAGAARNIQATNNKSFIDKLQCAIDDKVSKDKQKNESENKKSNKRHHYRDIESLRELEDSSSNKNYSEYSEIDFPDATQNDRNKSSSNFK